MRVTCNCCGARFDVPIRAVLAEADRLTRGARVTVPMPLPGNKPEAVNGNILLPGDEKAKRLRDKALARRGVKEK